MNYFKVDESKDTYCYVYFDNVKRESFKLLKNNNVKFQVEQEIVEPVIGFCAIFISFDRKLENSFFKAMKQLSDDFGEEYQQDCSQIVAKLEVIQRKNKRFKLWLLFCMVLNLTIFILELAPHSPILNIDWFTSMLLVGIALNF